MKSVGSNSQLDLEIGQRVAERRRRRIERCDGVVAAGLQPELDASSARRKPAVPTGRPPRAIEHAQHQHRGALAHRDLDLRQALADGQASDQGRERVDQPAHGRCEDGAAPISAM
jgi:hypothetical protein